MPGHAAIVDSLLLNYYFTPPIHTWNIYLANNALALGVFVVVALLVSSVVDMAARRTTQAARANAESELLTTTAGSVLRGQQGLSALLDRIREAFGMDSVTLLECTSPDGQQPADASADRIRGMPGNWHVVASRGEPAVTQPGEADVEVPVTDSLSLALRGRPLPAADRRVLGAFASYAAVALDQQRLAAEAKAAKPIAAADRMRTALLAAVSHDLRTPLASIKASVSSLRQTDVEWSEADEADLLATIEQNADRLDALIGNLLDMSRLHTGSLQPFLRPTAIDEVAPVAAVGLDDSLRLEMAVPDGFPLVLADPGLLERVLANLFSNALRYSPAGRPPELHAFIDGNAVRLEVVDHGPGVPDEQKELIFEPFERAGGRHPGVGLGLAVARGFAEAMGGRIGAFDTPGGGLTVRVTLPAASADRSELGAPRSSRSPGS